MRLISEFVQRKLGTLALIVMMLAIPTFAMAGEENVVLKFGQTDMVYLGISGAIGLIAIAVAYGYRKKILAMSPGDEKMQEVGKAINDGAMAYLAKQGKAISIFVVILGIGLGALYASRVNPQAGLLIALAFVGGVAASYIAGYMGMTMAVASNMRTANAALGKFGKALECAFQSGAVAGLFTVGMGLIGATAIFAFGGPNAMRLLIGFGFGGSLAALFMRVGGGIYTKAADVGADLVGKVEAGIPEDDPRNPAVIADNVGDNVGDCAGMAADVFESYEVTLVAAIVLGAATAAIFDQTTWMRLILFALMARGVGIIASIFGIMSVKGSDDVDSDPLKPISRGFQVSALIAIFMTAGLAWAMMGGLSSMGGVINSHEFVSLEQIQYNNAKKVQAIRDRIAVEQKKKKFEITVAEVAKDPEVKKIWEEERDAEQGVQQALGTPLEKMPKVTSLAGYTTLDLTDKENKVANYASQYMMVDDAIKQDPTKQPAKPKVTTLADRFKGQELKIFQVQITTPAMAQPNQPAQPAQTSVVFYGPVAKADFGKLVAEFTKQSSGQKIEVKGEYPVTLYSNAEGKIIAGIDDPSGTVKLEKMGNAIPITYFKESVGDVEKVVAATAPGMQMPPMESVTNTLITKKPVEWWRFFLCIFFGIVMAWIFERLTDYYVGLHRPPVQEVGAVATAGPAPMIIQGFALGLESSFFSVVAIVGCLLAPIMIFNPADFGGYILSFYGIALVGLGLLTTTGYILAMDTFGPISDNAQGVFEMSGCGHGNESATKGIQRLDAAGNTTKALTKGFAIATAVVAAVALFHSFVEEAKLAEIGMRLDVPEIFLGLLIGGAAPYLFSAFSINAVGRAAFQLINDVRDQFRNDPGIMAGTSKPNYGRCVAIVTAAAQRELLGPGILAIALPIAVAFGFSINKPAVSVGGELYNLTGAQALGGFLAGCIVSGQLLAVMLANSGGIWDNAKKLIEDGLHGGKGTEAHKAGVVCDTVGDPFKDTAGPALNPLIKVMNLIALLLVPVIITPMSDLALGVITGLAVLALAFAVYFSKRSSIGKEMAAVTTGSAPKSAVEVKADPAPQVTAEPVIEKTDEDK